MNIYKKSAVKLNELFNSAFSYFSSKYQAASKQFSIASAWGQLLNAIHELTQLLLFYAEDTATELNVETALRPDSIRGLAALAGHNPFFGNAANGVLFLYKNKAASSPNANVVLLNGTKLRCKNNGLLYTVKLDSDYIIIPKDLSQLIELKVFQGIYEEQEIVGTGEKLQSFSFSIDNGYYFDHDEVEVYVNNEKWGRVNSLLEMSYKSKTYYIGSSQQGLSLFFGNGIMGAVPPLGANIKIKYIKHNGAVGNIYQDNPLFEFEDSLYDSLGNEVEANQLYLLGVKYKMLFGADAEDAELTKRMLNRVNRSNILYTEDSFKLFLEKFNMYSTVRVFKKNTDNVLYDDNVVYIMLIPDISKRANSFTSYFSMPLDSFIISETEKLRIYEMIEKSGLKPSQLELQIVSPKIKKYALNISIVPYKGYLNSTNTIKELVKEAVGNYFLYNTRYDRIPKSDIIRIIENIEGVDSVSAFFVSQENEANRIKNHSSAELIGLDSFNDIILNQDEVAVLRGGWKDANGIYYSDSIDDEISMLNISFKF